METNIAEKFILLALRPDKPGFLVAGTYIHYGLAGAILFGMLKRNLVSLGNDGFLLPVGRQRNEEWPFGGILDDMAASKKPRKTRYWLQRVVANVNKYKLGYAGRLQQQRMVQIEHRKFLGLFPYKKYTLANVRAREALIMALRRCVLDNTGLDSESLSLLCLVEICKLYKVLGTDREDTRDIKRRLQELLAKQPLPDSFSAMHQEIKSAVTAAIAAAMAAAAG